MYGVFLCWELVVCGVCGMFRVYGVYGVYRVYEGVEEVYGMWCICGMCVHVCNSQPPSNSFISCDLVLTIKIFHLLFG